MPAPRESTARDQLSRCSRLCFQVSGSTGVHLTRSHRQLHQTIDTLVGQPSVVSLGGEDNRESRARWCICFPQLSLHRALPAVRSQPTRSFSINSNWFVLSTRCSVLDGSVRYLPQQTFRFRQPQPVLLRLGAKALQSLDCPWVFRTG